MIYGAEILETITYETNVFAFFACVIIAFLMLVCSYVVLKDNVCLSIVFFVAFCLFAGLSAEQHYRDKIQNEYIVLIDENTDLVSMLDEYDVLENTGRTMKIRIKED